MKTAHRIAPWYSAYLIQGLLTSGLFPFLLPLLVASGTRQLDIVAYVIGAYNLGLLAAPLFGSAAERWHLYRPMFFGAFLVLAVSFVSFPFGRGLLPWFLLSLLIGLATGASATIATLFVVNFVAKPEWEPSIGWLQSFNGAGQLAGLVLAGLVAENSPGLGFILGGVLALIAVAVGGIGLPRDHREPSRNDPFRHVPLQPMLRSTQLGPALGGLLPHSHHLQWSALRALRRALRAPFGRFLLAWASYNFGVAAFFAYYPLMMLRSYGVPTPVTAFAYAAATGIGIFLFLGASRLAARFGASRVFQSGLALRILGFLLLTLPFVYRVPGTFGIGLLGFMLAMLAWPVLSVSGTALAARLTHVGEGAAIGLLNASGALATVVGTFIGGPLVREFGFIAAPLLALVGLGFAALLMVGNAPPPVHPDAAASDTAAHAS